MEFNQRLMGLRKQKGWSQEQLGERVGVTRQTVSKWELGDTTPEMNKLIDLSRVFELSLDELAGQELSVHKKEVHHYRPSYEYKSKRTFRGLPLVHINIGPGLRRARGVIAIGNAATGIVAMGVCSAGVISLGGLSAGIISVGGLSAALLLSLGGIAAGAVAAGGLAVGIVSVGGLAVGIYSLGGCAIASKIAAGEYANAHIAIGDRVNGIINLDIKSTTAADIETAILGAFPKTANVLVNLFKAVSHQ